MPIKTKSPSTRKKSKPPSLIGDYPHKPQYDVRSAAEGFSNVAAVLSGFAFAAILLVIQIPNLPKEAELARDWATVAFIVAFLGCLLSSFTYSIVKAEEILAPRSFAMALLGGCGFTISGNLVFWGLATIVKVYLSESVYAFIYYSFPLIMSFTIVYIAFSAFDPIISFEKRKINWRDYAEAFGPAYTFLIPIVAFKYMGFSVPDYYIVHWFNWVMAGALIASIVSALVAILLSMAEHDFYLPGIASGLWIGFHAVVIGLLILMV